MENDMKLRNNITKPASCEWDMSRPPAPNSRPARKRSIKKNMAAKQDVNVSATMPASSITAPLASWSSDSVAQRWRNHFSMTSRAPVHSAGSGCEWRGSICMRRKA